jgi:hypothetical protein
MCGYVRARLNAPSLWVQILPSPKNQFKGAVFLKQIRPVRVDDLGIGEKK